MLKTILNLTKEQLDYIDELPPYGTAIFRDRRFPRRYLITVPNVLQIETITEAEKQRITQPFIQELQERYQTEYVPEAVEYKDYTEEDLEIIWTSMFDHTREKLMILREDPFTPQTVLHRKVKGGQNKFGKSIEFLLTNGFIVRIKLITSKTKGSTFYPLTKKAHDILKTPEHLRRPTELSFAHEYYKFLIGGKLTSKGYEVKIEYKDIDLFAVIDGKKTAFEITRSFKNLITNMEKCFMLDMDELYIVCEDEDKAKKAKNRIENYERTKALVEMKKDNIHYREIRDYL